MSSCFKDLANHHEIMQHKSSRDGPSVDALGDDGVVDEGLVLEESVDEAVTARNERNHHGRLVHQRSLEPLPPHVHLVGLRERETQDKNTLGSTVNGLR